ncbi:hypothetical protein Gotur_007727 [Gossypium turneri]
MIHEKKATSGLDLSQKIQSYLIELEGIRGSKISHAFTEAEGQDKDTLREIIQFDVAFDIKNFRSASGMVVRDQDGVIRANFALQHFISVCCQSICMFRGNQVRYQHGDRISHNYGGFKNRYSQMSINNKGQFSYRDNYS